MKYSISIVSHNSGKHIANLLEDLRKTLPASAEIILTINIPEDEFYLKSATGRPLKIIRNSFPLGFGANHNQAFASACGEKFVILNPDVRLLDNPWHILDSVFDQNTGACAPMVLNSAGGIEDSVRHYPTFAKFFRRVVFRDRRSDYPIPRELAPIDVEWAAGMFIMFDSKIFRAITGFDTQYFMYLEDADICRRLHAVGKKVLWVPGCRVVHDAQRASRRNWTHLRWHITSAVRFLLK